MFYSLNSYMPYSAHSKSVTYLKNALTSGAESISNVSCEFHAAL